MAIMKNNQLPIPGLEPSPGIPNLSYIPRRRTAGWSEDRITFLEKRTSALEVELSLMKIQMEKDYA